MGASASCIPGDAPPMSSIDYEELKSLWTLIEGVGLVNIGSIAFKGLFIKIPEAFAMFEFEPGKDWENSHHFHHHCETVMKTVGHMIQILLVKDKFQRNMDAMVSNICFSDRKNNDNILLLSFRESDTL